MRANKYTSNYASRGILQTLWTSTIILHWSTPLAYERLDTHLTPPISSQSFSQVLAAGESWMSSITMVTERRYPGNGAWKRNRILKGCMGSKNEHRRPLNEVHRACMLTLARRLMGNMGKPLAWAHPDLPVTVHIWRVVGGVIWGRYSAVPSGEKTATLYRRTVTRKANVWTE